jgi:hypothetical protein
VSAKAVINPETMQQTEMWRLFERITQARVREGNLVAGEPMWRVQGSIPGSHRLVIESIQDPADHLECSLTGGAHGIECRLSAAAGRRHRFPIAAAEHHEVDQAVSRMLDLLVWTERQEKR